MHLQSPKQGLLFKFAKGLTRFHFWAGPVKNYSQKFMQTNLSAEQKTIQKLGQIEEEIKYRYKQKSYILCNVQYSAKLVTEDLGEKPRPKKIVKFIKLKPYQFPLNCLFSQKKFTVLNTMLAIIATDIPLNYYQILSIK
eukprot:TRINITY_DN6199_c0_g1_i2.p4 TRINITY_DN6199_c0_g1~~TRINITY_DN6199_c0_g1_i2.p4  ORF type:complete len:139 (+),score=2.12 TRINITY_DN6199_c0_g1_i2:330-746(+)